MDRPGQPVPSALSIRIDDLLFRVRWVLILLVLPLVWIDLSNVVFPNRLLVWVVSAVIVNLIIGIILQFPDLATHLPLATLVIDLMLFAVLPFTAITRSNLLAYFMIYPAIVAAIRFGPRTGFLAALLLSLSLVAHSYFPAEGADKRDVLATGLPILATWVTALLSGYLVQHEREIAVKRAAQELHQLRGAMAGAKMLYQSTDTLNLTTNYAPVLETMLDAGVKGLPGARREDGPPVGIALLFQEHDAEQRLAIVASRNLDQRDLMVKLPGKAGIIAEAFRTGDAIVFDRIAEDPELGLLSTMQRCRSGVCFPLRAGIDLYGAMILTSPAPRRPSPDHLELMQAFTSQAGIAFQNAKLYQASRQEQDRIIQNDNEMRQKLARDLHDGPTQKIAGLAMQLDYIKRLLDSNLPDARAELDKARTIAQQATKEIRTALFTLRPLALESKGLSAALEQFGERLQEAEGVPIQVIPGEFGTELDKNIGTTVFAIIEEAVGNARKHGNNAPIFVSVQRKDNSLIAVVQDQGPGFDVEQVEATYDKRTSLGLQNMRERARLIDGNLSIVSAPGQGTRVTLAVPLPPARSMGARQ